MKRIFILALILCLLLNTAALAAPTRQLGQITQESEELIAQVQPLSNAVASAAIRQRLRLFRNGTAPEAALVLGFLQEALASHLVVKESVEGVVTLSDQDVQAAARQFFHNKELPDLKNTQVPGVQAAEGMLQFDLAKEQDFIGTHIYHVALTEEELLLMADIYTTGSIRASAVDAPEESLTWLGHIGMRLKPEADAPLGFTLASFAVPELYEPASWQPFKEDKRFELLYPDFLKLAQPQNGVLFDAQNADASTQLWVREEEGSLESLQAAWREESNNDQSGSSSWIEGGMLISYGQGRFRLAYADHQEGQAICLVLELRFPSEKEHEYGLIQAFLLNSFVVYSHSQG